MNKPNISLCVCVYTWYIRHILVYIYIYVYLTNLITRVRTNVKHFTAHIFITVENCIRRLVFTRSPYLSKQARSHTHTQTHVLEMVMDHGTHAVHIVLCLCAVPLTRHRDK